MAQLLNACLGIAIALALYHPAFLDRQFDAGQMQLLKLDLSTARACPIALSDDRLANAQMLIERARDCLTR